MSNGLSARMMEIHLQSKSMSKSKIVSWSTYQVVRILPNVMVLASLRQKLFLQRL